MIFDVFISYSSKDQKVVEALSHYLEERGVRCFVAYRDIPKGKVWAGAIVEAIEQCKMMVVIFSKDFNLSDQVDREIELCAGEKKPILTFRIHNVDFTSAKKYYLTNINWIDAFPNPTTCFDNLYESVKKLIAPVIIPQQPSVDSVNNALHLEQSSDIISAKEQEIDVEPKKMEEYRLFYKDNFEYFKPKKAPLLEEEIKSIIKSMEPSIYEKLLLALKSPLAIGLYFGILIFLIFMAFVFFLKLY